MNMPVKARSGVYFLTIFTTQNGVFFKWGCREGDDLPAYLAKADPPYPEQTRTMLLGMWAYMQTQR